MSVQRRSSSPLSSASPSPVQAAVAVNGNSTLASLSLGPAATTPPADDSDIGGSSPTTLTEPLTDSELTEEEDDDGDIEMQDDSRELDAAETIPRPSADSSRLQSASPSLTPPPPSDPPRSDALPSSPMAEEAESPVSAPGDDAAEADDEGALDDDEEASPEDDDDDAGTEIAEKGEGEAAGSVQGDVDDDEDGGDVTMRAEDAASIGDAAAEEEEAADEGAAEDAEDEDEDETADPSSNAAPTRLGYSSHAPPPTPAAMRALFALEVKFAALRDRLYVERLEEAAREEEMMLNGTHPALLQLNAALEVRRERLHEVASRRYGESLADLKTWQKIEKKISWSTWTDQRDRLHWEEFEHTWSKRRRLAREKTELETLKVARPIPRADRPPRQFDWSAGAMPPRLTNDEGLHDLQLMDARRQQQLQQQASSRHVSPALYGGLVGPASTTFPYQAQQPPNYTASMSEADRRAANQAARPSPTAALQASRPGAPPQRKLNADPFITALKEAQPADPKVANGHSRTLGLGLSSAPPTSTPDSKPAASASAPPSSQPAAGPSARFPGLAEYLSGSATPPQNSFQHHLLSSTAGQTPAAKTPLSSQPARAPASTGMSTLGRPFAQPQPQASAQRS